MRHGEFGYGHASISPIPWRNAWAFTCVCLLVCGINLAQAGAQEILIVSSSGAKPYEEAHMALLEALVRQGHKARSVRLDQLSKVDLEKLRQEQPQAVVALGSGTARTLDGVLPKQVPLVFCMVADDASLDLDRSRPVAGVEMLVPLKKQLDLISQTLPRARKVGMLYRSGDTQSAHVVEQLKAELPAGWSLEAVAVDQHSSFAKALDALLKTRPDIVWTSPDAEIFNSTTIRALLLEALRCKVPVFGFSPAFVRSGALLGVGIDPSTQGVQAAALVHALAGADVKSVPRAAQEPRFSVAVNLVVAEKLELEMPREIVNAASEVIGKP